MISSTIIADYNLPKSGTCLKGNRLKFEHSLEVNLR